MEPKRHKYHDRVMRPQKTGWESRSLAVSMDATPEWQSQVASVDAAALNKTVALGLLGLAHDFGRLSVLRPQAKLAVSQPGDPEEQQADRIAEQIMALPSRSGDAGKCGECSEESPCAKCAQEKVYGKELSGSGLRVTPQFENSLPLAGSGQPLPSTVRHFFEPRFGADFANVRVHTNDEAAASAETLGARAYTLGNHIVLGTGQYAPESRGGLELLAHELVHVVQQSDSPDGVVQRATDQPELQAGIGVGQAVGSPTAGFLMTCISRASILQLGFGAYRVVEIIRSSGAEQNRLINEFIGSLVPPLGFLTTICDCLPPQLITALAKWGLKTYPDAIAHLEHYLTGGGKPYVEDIPRMLTEDAGVKARIEGGIAGRGTPSGRLDDWVTQPHWSTKNWLYALGNVDVFKYEILQDDAGKASNAAAADGTALVRVSIQDPYEWHPDEFRQIPCLHTGLEAMKAGGAADFIAMGEGVVRLKVPASLVPLP